MIHVANFILNRTQQLRPILIDWFYSKEFTNQPIAIFCHGYKGFKDWGPWNLMCNELAESGICAIKFNFSFNGGTVQNPIDFPDLEAFGQNNYSKELNDLEDVISWAIHHFRDNPFINSENINLIGHSRGGGIVLLQAHEDSRIKKVITLAGVSDYQKRFGTDEEIAQWQKTGVKYVLNGRTKQNMPHYFQFYEDFIANKNRLNIQVAAENCKIPHLIIHGGNDTSVRVEEATALHHWNPRSQLQIIKDADHVFNTKHPWDKKSLTKELDQVKELISSFIHR